MKKFLTQQINFTYAVIVMLTLVVTVGSVTAAAPGGNINPIIHQGGADQAMDNLKIGTSTGTLGALDVRQNNSIAQFIGSEVESVMLVSSPSAVLGRVLIGDNVTSAVGNIWNTTYPLTEGALAPVLQRVNVYGKVRATNLDNSFNPSDNGVSAGTSTQNQTGQDTVCVDRVGELQLCPQGPVIIVPPAINGSCGSANGTTSPNPPTNNLCADGSPSIVSVSNGTYSWTCFGSNGGTDASCTANETVTTITYDWNIEGWGDCNASSGGTCQGQYTTPSSCSGPNFGTVNACIRSYYIPGHSGYGAYQVEVVPSTSCREPNSPLNTYNNWEMNGDYSEINCQAKNQTQCSSHPLCTWAYDGHTPAINGGGLAVPGSYSQGCLPTRAVKYATNQSEAGPMPYNQPGYYPAFSGSVNPWHDNTLNVPNFYSCSAYQSESLCNSNTPDGCDWTPEETISCGDQLYQSSCIAENSACTWNPGGSTQSRVVTCQDSSGNVVADSFCSSPKPETEQSCTSGGTTYSWHTGEWSAPDGYGLITRTVDCRDEYNNVVLNSFCPPPMPDSTGTSNGKVICTELHRQGYISDENILADNTYAAEKIDQKTLNAYHFWAKPLVKLMKKSQFVTEAVRPYGVAWAQHMAFIQGVSETDSYLGNKIHSTFLPIHDWIAGGESQGLNIESNAGFSLAGFILFFALIIFLVGIILVILLPLMLILYLIKKGKKGLKEIGKKYLYVFGVMLLIVIISALF
jgi:hypothetical protein